MPDVLPTRDSAQPAPRKYQVFVSSTYEDLKDERRAVTEVILSMGHIPVGMELFAAGNEDQWSYIKKRIAEVDYYLVIVAERYGSEGPAGLSYTEMEYRFARETGVPLAGLLLDGAARSRWPAERIDFEKRKKVDDFRALCQEGRMVAYWSDTGTLTTKSMLALTNLVSSYPRHGWISGDQAMSPQLAVELARLSEENARLRAQVETLQTSHKPDQNVMLAASRLRRPLLVEVEKASKRFPERYRAMTADPITAKTLGQTSIFDFAFQQPDIFLDGGPEADLDRIFSRYLATSVEHLPEQDGKLHTMALLAMFNFLMRTWGLLEAYNVEAPSSAGTRIQKWVRFSSLGRSGFERATTEFLENAEPAGESDPTPGEAALIRPAG